VTRNTKMALLRTSRVRTGEIDSAYRCVGVMDLNFPQITCRSCKSQCNFLSLWAPERSKKALLELDIANSVRRKRKETERDPKSMSTSSADLYSRQLLVLGQEAQQRLESASVLLCGRLSGLGQETAKGLLLAGVRRLVLRDCPGDAKCALGDLSSGFCESEQDVREGRLRVDAVLASLRPLNSNVILEKWPQEEPVTFDDHSFGSFDVVVLIHPERAFAVDVSKYCHFHQPKPISCIIAGTFGLYGFVFCDFGPEFTVLDANGEAPKQGIVMKIEISERDGCKIIFHSGEDKHHGLENGDFVKFHGIRGISGLNDGEPREISLVQIQNENGALVDGFAFSLKESENFELNPDALDGGYYEQVKFPVKVSFKSLAESLNEPALVANDWIDMDRPKKLHALLLALWEFSEKNDGKSPKPGASSDADQIVSIARRVAGEIFGLELLVADERKMKLLAIGAAGQLSPMAALIGGITAQETLKACSQKFSPLQQWFHFGSETSLPRKFLDLPFTFPTVQELEGSQIDGVTSRYAGQAATFGWELQEKLGILKCFMIGAGALGCENLKNMALMGVGTDSSDGKFTVSDMDGIEISNLNRQFLFRPHHIGAMKSKIAAKQAQQINPNFNVEALESKVAPETESIFTDEFWEEVDVVINALDNVQARLYVDSKCLFHRKPLLESGTLGTKANTLPVVPFLTESYGSDPVKDETDGEIPACTLHAYPNLIEHALAWSRDAVFEKYFHLDPTEASRFLESPSPEAYFLEIKKQPSTMLSRIKAARSILAGPRPTDHQEKLFPYELDLVGRDVDAIVCVELARMRFEELFVNKIKQLLHVHPLNKTVDDEGTKFWSGKRRPPKVEHLNLDDPLHVKFLAAAAWLYASVYNLDPNPLSQDELTRMKQVKELAASLDKLPDYEADESVKVPENDEEAKNLKEEQEKEAEAEAESEPMLQTCDNELKKLKAALNCKGRVQIIVPQIFEKDDDSNGHLDLIFSAACIRARSYDIPLVDRLEAKRIVGQIIPAIATTTAAATGAIMLELYKLLDESEGARRVERFRATNFNLATNSYAIFEPTPCKTRRFGKGAQAIDVSIWTMITLEGDLSVQEVMDHFEEQFNFEVMTISTEGDLMLYNDMFGQEDRLESKVSVLFSQQSNKSHDELPKYIVLNIDGDFLDENGEEDENDDNDDDDDDDDDIAVPPCRINWRSPQQMK